jgi:hypothetical protein
MTTKNALASRIADDLARTDLTTQISNAIDDAIEHWKTTRLHFNETRSVTFTSVANQAIFTSSDSESIPLMFEIDTMHVSESGGIPEFVGRDGKKQDFNTVHDLILTGGGTGKPYMWAWFDRSIYLYPIPESTNYTFRLTGAIEKAAPASGNEANNVWMTEAFDLLRCHAKGLVYLHVINALDKAALMLGPQLDGRGGACGAAYRRLRREASDKRGLGVISPSRF